MDSAIDLSYYTSETFIHDNLKREVQTIVQSVSDLWLPEGPRFPPVLVAWPREPVKDDVGKLISGRILLQVDPDSKVPLEKLLVDFVERTKAYAFLVVQDYPEGLEALLESPLGTSWWLIDQHHGKRRITQEDNRKSIGLLWHPPALN